MILNIPLLVVFISVFSLLLSSFPININAQVAPQQNDEQTSSATTMPTSSTDKPYGVRVTSPSDGDNIYINGSKYFTPTGENLALEGFAVANNGNNLTNCIVSIITNSVFPYQVANATGSLGDDDYSSWKYEFSQSYAHIDEGPNRITSKVTCQPENFSAYYSINLTGINFNGTFPSLINSIEESDEFIVNNLTSSDGSGLDVNKSSIEDKPVLVMPVTNVAITSPIEGEKIDLEDSLIINGTSVYPSNYECEVQVADGSLNGVIVPNSANQSLFKKTVPLGTNGTNDYSIWTTLIEPNSSNLKNGTQPLTAKLQCFSPMSSVKFAKVNIVAISPEPIELKSMDISIDKIGQSQNQKIIFTLDDTLTNDPIIGATLSGSINSESFSGTTDTNGKYTLNIPENIVNTESTVMVSITASAEGYKAKKSSTSFEILPTPSITDTPSTEETTDVPNNEPDSRDQELADKIFSDVQEQLSKQGINIPLPFG